MSSTNAFRELAMVLHDVAWKIQRLEPQVAGMDPLPVSELAVLKTIDAQPGVSVSGIAAELDLLPNNVSAAVRSLAQRGLVQRRSDPGDKRVVLLHPSDRAMANREAIHAAWASSVTEGVARLPEPQVEALLAAQPALEALLEHLRQVPAHPGT